MLIFTLPFTKSWKIETSPVTYPVFVLSGLILWKLFHSSVSHAGESMIQHAAIIKKIYFPRLIILGSAVLVAFFDFIIGLIIFLVFCIIYKQPLHWQAILFFPAGILLILVAGFGAGTFLAALNVKYRDFRYTIPFLLQFLFFASQVIYPLQQVQQSWLRYVLSLNPVNAAVELFRAPLKENSMDTDVVLIGTLLPLLYWQQASITSEKPRPGLPILPDAACH